MQCLKFLHNYFGSATKLFSDLVNKLHLVNKLKFLDTSAKSFFPFINVMICKRIITRIDKEPTANGCFAYGL